MRRTLGRIACLAVVAALVGSAAGCSKAGPKVAQLSGKVMFKGKPVPAGFITLMPDSSAGNPGPLKSVPIKDGVYDTAQAPDPGIQPGITIVSIYGFDGKMIAFYPQGKQIFNRHELKETIPEGVTTKDFVVPESAANNLIVAPTSDAAWPLGKGS